MELAVGHKQTEVGVIPDDWSVVTIGDHCSCFSGGTPATSNRDYYGGTIPWITSGDLNSERIVAVNGRITRKGLEHSSAKMVPEGTLLLALYGATAGVAAVTQIQAAINQAILAIQTKSINTQYLFQYLRFRKDFFLHSYLQGGQPNLSGEIVKSFMIPLPHTMAEQEAIAEALSDADAYVESLEQLIAKKRLVKQGAMQDLVTGKKRLAGFDDEWVLQRLEDVADIRSGGTPSTYQSLFWDGGVLWCTPTDITGLEGGKYLDITTRTISALGLKSSSAEIIPPRSVVMTSRATIGECAINRVPVTTNQGFKNFVPRPDVDVEFLYYRLLTQKQNFVSLCGGSTFLEIGKSQLLAFTVLMPSSKDEQVAIAAVLSDIDSEIELLEQRLEKARDIKQGMMQNLLTGRIRLV